MEAVAIDDDPGAFVGFLLGRLLHARDQRAGGVDDGAPGGLGARRDVGRRAVGGDGDGGRLNLLQPILHLHPLPGQALHQLRVVDQRAQRVDLRVLLPCFRDMVERHLDAEAHAHLACELNFHQYVYSSAARAAQPAAPRV